MAQYSQLPVPRQWSSFIKSAFLHTISLASAVFTSACVLGSKRKWPNTRQNAELAQAYHEIALLREEMTIKDERFRRISPHRRPYYSPIQRMQILKLRAARRWSITQTAKAFHITEQTIISWMRRVDEEGEHALLQLPDRVSRFPDFVRFIVRQLKAYFPGLGKKKIAQILARAGLHLGVTTVSRMLKEKPVLPEVASSQCRPLQAHLLQLRGNPKSPIVILQGVMTDQVCILEKCSAAYMRLIILN